MSITSATLAPSTPLPPLARREFARRIFWTVHPLCELCAVANGEWENGQFFRRGDFSLAQLLAFVEQLPSDIFLRLTEGGPFNE